MNNILRADYKIGIEMTYFHVEAAVLELIVLLAQGAPPAEAMDEAIVARALVQQVLFPHSGSVDA